MSAISFAAQGVDDLLQQSSATHASKASNRAAAASTVAGRLYLLSSLGFGLVEMMSAKALPELHPYPTSSPAAVYVSGATLATFAVAGMTRWLRLAGTVLGAHWLLALGFIVAAALAEPFESLGWVPASKAALLALAGLTLSGWTAGNVLRGAFGVAMILYGLVHLVFHDLIAGLVPVWIPLRTVWPYFTGALMLTSGAALVVGKAVAPMAMTVAVLFASWILLVHLERLAAAPSSSFEWTFALSALALTGIALMVASATPSRGSRD